LPPSGAIADPLHDITLDAEGVEDVLLLLSSRAVLLGILSSAQKCDTSALFFFLKRIILFFVYLWKVLLFSLPFFYGFFF
jgi:hypothetical protein